jgi:hypothetical protein
VSKDAIENNLNCISQDQRFLPYLNPEKVPIDNRSLSELLAFLENYSKALNYYNTDIYTDTIKRDGDWSFFTSHYVFRIAKIANLQPDAFAPFIESAVDTFQNATTSVGGGNSDSSISDMIYAVRLFFEIIVDIFTELNNWLLETKDFTERFSNDLIAIIDLEARPNLTEAIGYAKFFDANINPSKYVYLSSSFLDSLGPDFWQNFREGSIKYKKLLEGEYELARQKYPAGNLADHNFLKDNYTVLLKLITELVIVRKHVIILAQRNINLLLEGDGNVKPDLALLITFLNSFKTIQTQLNSLTGEHLDFYFKNILNLKLQSLVPDIAALMIALNPTVDEYLIPEGTLFDAGKDALGNVIKFRLLKSSIINQITLSETRVLHLASNDLLQPAKKSSSDTFVTGIYDQTYVYPAQNQLTPYLIFGEDQLPYSPRQMTMSESNIGFAFSSELLFLGSGSSALTIDLQFDPNTFKTCFLANIKTIIGIDNPSATDITKINSFLSNSLLKNFLVQATGKTGWTILECSDILIKSLDEPVIRFIFYINANSNPIVGFNPLIHAGNYSGQMPVIQFTLLNNTRYFAYNFFKNLIIEKININVKVVGLTDLALCNQFGVIKPEKPYPPFGMQPQKGNYLIIGSNELLAKGANNISINIVWDNLLPLGDFQTYYQNYKVTNPINNTSFKVNLFNLKNQQWKAVTDGNAAVLFNSVNSPSLKKDILSPNSVITFPVTDASTIDKVNNINVASPLKYDTTSANGFIKIELSDPAFGFGSSIYPDSLSEVVMDNARVKTNSLLPDTLNITTGLSGLQTQVKTLPNAPFTPIVDTISLNYEVSAIIDLSGGNKEGNYYHVDVFNQYMADNNNAAASQSSIANGLMLLPSYEAAHTFYMGFNNTNLSESVNVYFQLKEGNIQQTKQVDTQVNWFYYSTGGWKAFKNLMNLNDTTNNLIKSGIITFDIPGDASYNNPSLSAGKVWIKAEINGFNDNSILSLNTQVIQVQFANPAEVTRTGLVLPAQTITKSINAIPEIKEIKQPTPSEEGMPEESPADFYVRVSENLRHKNRAILSRGYELLILSKFPTVYKAKYIQTRSAISTDKSDSQPNVNIVVVPYKQKDINDENKPRLGLSELEQIKQYLQDLASHNARINILNPVYEELSIKCKVKFISNDSFYLKKLEGDILAFFLSDINHVKNRSAIGEGMQKSQIQSYIQNLSYVLYITGFSIIKTAFLNTSYDYFDSANIPGNDPAADFIPPATPYSIFIACTHHYIEILDSDQYCEPTPIGINEMIIEDNMIIGPKKIK